MKLSEIYKIDDFDDYSIPIWLRNAIGHFERVGKEIPLTNINGFEIIANIWPVDDRATVLFKKNNDIVGYTSLQKTGDFLKIPMILILPKYRSKGIASGLYKFLLNHYSLISDIEQTVATIANYKSLIFKNNIKADLLNINSDELTPINDEKTFDMAYDNPQRYKIILRKNY